MQTLTSFCHENFNLKEMNLEKLTQAQYLGSCSSIGHDYPSIFRITNRKKGAKIILIL